MKTLLGTLFFTVVLSVTASAAPLLAVTIDLLERSDAGDKTLAHPTLYIESGKQGTVQSGRFEYSVTPILLDNGIVDVSTTLTEHDSAKAIQVVEQRTKAKLGHATEVRVGELVFQTTTSLAK